MLLPPGALRAVFSNAKACQKLPEILQQFFDNIEGTIVGLVEGLEQGYQALLDDEGHAVEDNQVPAESPRSHHHLPCISPVSPSGTNRVGQIAKSIAGQLALDFPSCNRLHALMPSCPYALMPSCNRLQPFSAGVCSMH